MSHDHAAQPTGKYLAALSLGALGVVYGDIGTSPMYALEECFVGSHAVAANLHNVLGLLSLILWSLILVVSIKYLVFVMRADSRGEGGILSLLSLIAPRQVPGARRKKRHIFLVSIALFGAALLYGDGMITPAITVLSAVEGLQEVTPFFTPYVIPISIVILCVLFLIQRRGTAGIGVIFGPFMLLWFATLGAAGVWQIAQNPSVLMALNPWYGVRFFLENGWHGFLALGSVFLVVTGGEALYADMGHFGIRPIRLAWFTLVLPALVLNYFGQAALIERVPTAARNPFFLMFPSWALLPMIVISTVAASIASQAVISGAFSLTRQAVQLGYSPRMEITHTSKQEIGQIYITMINWVLAICTILLVLGFQTSTALANAYGVAVTTTMVITTILFCVVARQRWNWSMALVLLIGLVFIIPDIAFFTANIVKVHQGGWFPLLVGAIIFTLMTTWRRGREILDDRLREGSLPIDVFLQSLQIHEPHRVRGTAIFMFRDRQGTPTALLHNLKHNQVLHERVILLTVEIEEVSHVHESERYEIEAMGLNIFRVVLHYGFFEDIDLPAALRGLDDAKLGSFDPATTTYFLGRETLIVTRRPGMAIWREKLFAWMTNNARNAASFFKLPPNRVVEMGAQIEL